MNQHQQILEVIYRAALATNEAMDPDRQLVLVPETCLFGSKSILNSLELVGLILNIEREVEEAFGVAITLADERAMSQKSSPFKSIHRLAEYIALLLNESNAQ